MFDAIRRGEESGDVASTAAGWITLVTVEATDMQALLKLSSRWLFDRTDRFHLYAR